MIETYEVWTVAGKFCVKADDVVYEWGRELLIVKFNANGKTVAYVTGNQLVAIVRKSMSKAEIESAVATLTG